MLSPTEYETEENFVEELETLADEADESEIEIDEDDTSFEL